MANKELDEEVIRKQSEKSHVLMAEKGRHLQQKEDSLNKMSLKEVVFFRTKAELDGYLDMKNAKEYTSEEKEEQRQRFCSAYQIIKEAGLEKEYESWKEMN